MKQHVARAVLFAVNMACLALVALAAQKAANVAGDWDMSWNDEDGAQSALLTIEQEAEKISGTLSNNDWGDGEVTGTVQGNELAFTIAFAEDESGPEKIECTAAVDADSMKGTCTPEEEEAIRWTAKRRK